MFEIIVLLLLIIYLYLTYLYFRMAVVRRITPRFSESKYRESEKYKDYADEIIENIKWYRKQKLEEIKIKSGDGLILVGNYFPGIHSSKTIILFHGYHSTAYNDFAGLIKYYHEKNYNLIIVDQRGHGRSEGKYIGFGVLERKDAKKWVEYAYNRFGTDMTIYLHGMSLGATTVLMASNFIFPKNVRGIIADCGFTSPNEIISKVIKDKYRLPGWLFVPMMSLYSRFFAHYGFYDFSTKKALKNAKVPILLFHGTGDKYVPSYMSEENFNACSLPKKLVLIDGAVHGMSFFKDKARCIKELEEFLENTK